MVDLRDLMTLQGQLFLLILIGVFFRRYLVDEHFQKGLTTLVVDLILPCNIIASFQMEIQPEMMDQALLTALISVAVQVGSWLLAVSLFRRQAESRRAVLRFSTLCSNAGFLGTPIAEGLFGAEGILLTSIYLIPQRIMMWTVGLSFFTGKGSKGVVKKVLLNPCLLAVAAGMILFLFKIPLPAILNNTISSLGKCNTGLSVVMIGMLISDFQPKDFLDPMILGFSAVRLGLIPLLVYLLGRAFQLDALSASVSVILSAMPAGATTALLAGKHNGDAHFAAGCITVSTILSLVAIPIWCVVL